MANLD